MSLNSLIINTLKPLGVPVAFQTYSGNESTYITFFEYNQRGALHAEDEEKRIAHSIQVDICSTGDYMNLAKQVKDKLLSIGFTRIMETEFYEPDIKLYQKVIRFNYVQ